MPHGPNELQREKRRQQRTLTEIGVKKFVRYRKFAACGHTANIGDAKAGVCFMCRVAEGFTTNSKDK